MRRKNYNYNRKPKWEKKDTKRKMSPIQKSKKFLKQICLGANDNGVIIKKGDIKYRKGFINAVTDCRLKYGKKYGKNGVAVENNKKTKSDETMWS